jgi:hypothetical protein
VAGYRLDKNSLLDILEQWNWFLKRKVHLIACGGTAMTLLDIKASTKDVDFMIPNVSEHTYLTKTIQKMGYRSQTAAGWKLENDVFVFDLFSGNKIHTTELLDSPLGDGKHTLLKEFSRLYVGVLNDFDLISSKLIRGTGVDMDDCTTLVKARGHNIDIDLLTNHFREMASYDIAVERANSNYDRFLDRLREENLYE